MTARAENQNEKKATRSFDPTQQYGAQIEPTQCDFNTMRAVLQRQIDDSWVALGAPDDAKRLIEVAAYEVGGLVELAWLYPGNPRISTPYSSAADMLSTCPRNESK